MELLTAAVALVGALCLANLALTVGVIRRLREHNEALAKLSRGSDEQLIAAAGTLVADFAATTTAGEHIGRWSGSSRPIAKPVCWVCRTSSNGRAAPPPDALVSSPW
jgi:hypothetical protein